MENEINEEIEEIFDKLERSLPKKNTQVVRAVERSRLLIADILAKYTGSDGKIPRNRLSTVLNDLAKLEGEIYRNLRDELRVILTQTSEQATLGIAEAVVTIIGLATLIEIAGIPEAISDLTVGVVEAIFSALTGSTYRKYTDSAILSAFNRIGEDDLVLSDRLRNIARTIRKEIETTLRQSIRKGEGTAEILRKVDGAYSDLDWRLDTLVETEAMYVMRQVVAKFGEESGLVSAVKIVDFPHGKPGEHERHKCHIYANRDEHGLGKGVYPIGTRKIRNPHPRCRSRLLYVLVNELK